MTPCDPFLSPSSTNCIPSHGGKPSLYSLSLPAAYIQFNSHASVFRGKSPKLRGRGPQSASTEGPEAGNIECFATISSANAKEAKPRYTKSAESWQATSPDPMWSTKQRKEECRLRNMRRSWRASHVYLYEREWDVVLASWTLILDPDFATGKRF